MAVFGAPLAADDHAARAVEAALEMREALEALGGRYDTRFVGEFRPTGVSRAVRCHEVVGRKPWTGPVGLT